MPEEEQTTEPTETVTTTEPIQLPDDHPLVKTLAAQKEKIASLKAAQLDPKELERLRKLDEDTKTEAQKKDELIAELQGKVAEYEIKEQVSTWKAEVAKATGVPAAALAGSTKEEIEAHAEALKPLLKDIPAAPSANGQGEAGKTISVGELSADEIVEKATRR